MSSSSSPTKSREGDANKDKDIDESKKPLTQENKLETRLNSKDLEALQEAFEFKGGPGFDGALSLNREQFAEALHLILSKGTKEDYGELFDKIDISREGKVDWDKFASHMLLEFYEKDDRQKSTQLPQWKDLKYLIASHKDIIQRVLYLRNSSRYMAVSKEGTITLWGQDLQLQRLVKTGTDTCKLRDLWITDVTPLTHVNKLAIAYTSKEIGFYDMSSKMDFSCQYKLQGLTHTPLCLDYWSNPDDVNESVLVWGDVTGTVNALFFSSANIALFERPTAPSQEKQDATLNIRLNDIIKGKFKTSKFVCHHGHTDWVREVRYLPNLECFLSCSTTWNSAMVIGWMEKQTQSATGLKRDGDRRILKLGVFQVQQGINAFDYHEALNLIATAGVNHHVCLWNPYVVSKPNGLLRGHMAAVIQVQFNRPRNQLISFSKDKVLRIWDVQLQVCIQRLAGMFPKGPEVSSVLLFHEERSRLFITFNQSLTLLEMKPEVKDKIMSHDKPVVSVVFNSIYSQVVSASVDGTLICWMIDTGQKVKTIAETHGVAELTSLTQDPNETRIYTGSTDGTVKIWDLNGHCYHTLVCAGNEPADVGQVVILKRSIVVVGFARHVTVFRTATFRNFQVEPSEWKGGQEHNDDILAAAFLPSQTMATGSYDGSIVVWNTNSEVASRRMDQRSRKQNTPRSESRTVTPTAVKRKDDEEAQLTVSKLIFLSARKFSSNKTANLISSGGNGIIRMWNSTSCSLLAEFVAHEKASSIVMNVDDQNQYLVTGDNDGLLKVFLIEDYCVDQGDTLLTELPQINCQWTAHSDLVSCIYLTVRNDRTLVITGSSDCSVGLWDVHGNKIGVFGQEEHWKIEDYSIILEAEALQHEEEEEPDVVQKIEPDEVSNWEPEPGAVSDPDSYRINTWEKTVLGKDYQELRVTKRERKQPSNMPDLPYLFSERTGAPPFGPFYSLDITEFRETGKLRQPDFMENPDKYFREKEDIPTVSDKLPLLAETLKAAFDERSLFPKYVTDFENQMRKFHTYQLTNQTNKFRNNLNTAQTISGSPVRRPGQTGVSGKTTLATGAVSKMMNRVATSNDSGGTESRLS